MWSFKKITSPKRCKGMALLLSLIFIAIFSALAVSIASLSNTNLQLASQQHQINNALCAAQSGLEIMKKHLSSVIIPGTSQNKLQDVTIALGNYLNENGISNISLNYNPSTKTLTISNVTLDSQSYQSFGATITQPDANGLAINIIGNSNQFNRKISANFNYISIGKGVFDYGVATKGALLMSGQSEVSGVNLAVEASVYIEGDGISGDAFSITNQASVAGDVTIANQYSSFSIGTSASVGGATGAAAYDHVFVGADYVEFPTPNPNYFKPLATGEIIDQNTNWSNHAVLENVTIAANTNPTFASEVTINGLLFIEKPNTVTFTAKTNVNGVIVADGNTSQESSDCSISFAGQVVCNDVLTLEGAQFEQIKKHPGTFILAPGFSLSFSGQELYMNGAICGNGISFSGQAGGTVNGTIINYSKTPMTLSGQSTLLFNRSGIGTTPSGFSSDITLEFQTNSYCDISL